MKELEHYYTLSPEWHNNLAGKINAKVKDNRLMIMPESIGKGYSFFLEVIPGLSVLLLDFVLSQPIKIKRLGGEHDLQIIHFDLSDEVNSIQVQDAVYKIGYMADLGFAITRNDMDNVHQYIVGKRVFTLRLIVDKELLNPLLYNVENESVNQNKLDKKAIYFCDYIDSNSKILLHTIKNKSIFNESFEFHLKGTALRLLANLAYRYAMGLPREIRYAKKRDVEAFNATKKYLLDNLKNSFPGIPLLANMAKMSVSKYKLLFFEIEKTSPNVFFGKNKMLLAQQLLRSGLYSQLTDIATELNYKRLDYFNKKYFSNFRKKASEDFVKKRE